MKEFDYDKAIANLEEIALKVEDPTTGLDEIDALLKSSSELIAECRKYLRTARETVESFD